MHPELNCYGCGKITELLGLEGTSKDHQVQLPATAGTLHKIHTGV